MKMAIVTARNKHRVVAAILLASWLLYGLTGHRAVATAVGLETAVDRWIPFTPWTVWIYVTYPFMFMVAYLIEDDPHRVGRWMWATIFVNALSNVAFLLWPVALDRGRYGIPGDVGTATAALLRLVRSLDTPNNCCPSLHVSTSYLSFVAVKDRGKVTRLLMFTWATATAVSTLTTKQHYFSDVVAGFSLSIMAHRLFLSYRANSLNMSPSGLPVRAISKQLARFNRRQP